MVVVGSSYFRPIGAGEVTGPTGATGAIGPTGPTGDSIIGPVGPGGGDIIAMYIETLGTGALETIWDVGDGSGNAGTTGGITAHGVRGGTGDTWTIVDGSNTGEMISTGWSGGATVFKERTSETDILLKSIAVTGDSIAVWNESSYININFDRGFFGYINVTGSAEGTGGVGDLVVTDSVIGEGFTGYGISGGTSDAFGVGGLNVQIKNYKEKSKYFLGGPGGGGTFDFYDTTPDNPGEEETTPPIYTLRINPNEAKLFELDMRQPGLSGDLHIDGWTGPFQSIEIDNANFGYTGNKTNFATDIGKAFTLIVHGATFGFQNNAQFGNSIWPFDRQPCFSGGTDIFNFFWLPCTERNGICPDDAAWHGNIVQWKSPDTVVVAGTETDPFFCNNEQESAQSLLYYPEGMVDFYGTERSFFGATGSTGACCRGDGECIHTQRNLCTGYFHGAGTTCGITSGNTGSICFGNSGACCVYYEQTNKIECYNNFNTDECLTLGQLSNISTTYGGIDSICDDMDCIGASNDLGACCDGRGYCCQRTEIDCESIGNFFLGVGSICRTKDGTLVCPGGTGACCRSDGTCDDGVTGDSCISAGDIYAGNSSTCLDIECERPEFGSCVRSVDGLDLYPGAGYAGGVVVGLYRPLGSQVFGTSSFGEDKDATWNELMIGATGSLTSNKGLTCDIYRSKYDYHGYGFTSAQGCGKYNNFLQDEEDSTRPDAYYIVVSVSPIAITGDREVVSVIDYPGATQEFYWGNRGSSWGPLHNRVTNQYDDLSDKYKTTFKLSEGYWYNGNIGDASLNILGSNTFTGCKKARRLGTGHIQKLITKPLQTAHGLWHRNWGLYNNARIISADNALSQGYNLGGGYTAEDFGPGLTGNYISAFRATRLLDDNLVGTTAASATGTNIPEVSPWYIPSTDEMSFIAAHCIKDSPYDINLNAELLNQGGVPIDGWHWTSTGAFDELKGKTGTGEGVIGTLGSTADPGTLAWAMKFDINGVEENFRIGKKNRTRNTYTVRPIRLIRCDGQYATGGQGNENLWKLPKVLRDADKGINQQ